MTFLYRHRLGLGDIEIMQCNAIIAAKDIAIIANIVLAHFAVVNKAEHHTTSVS